MVWWRLMAVGGGGDAAYSGFHQSTLCEQSGLKFSEISVINLVN